MTQGPGWDLYRSFLGVLRLGSLSAAARELGLTQPTLGRHIAELETSLGAPLFARSQAGLVPTDMALSLRPHAEAIASAADALMRAASGEVDEPRGVVRLTASEFIGGEVLPPILTQFREAHPHIAIELSLSDRNEDLLRRDADIAVRMTRPTQAALVARHIGKVEIGLYAHRDYLARRGTPNTLDELTSHAIIGFDKDANAIRAMRHPGLAIARAQFAFRSDHEQARLSALRAGFGIGGSQVALASGEPDLVRLLPSVISYSLDMWLAIHEDQRTSRRVRLLFDHLAEALTAYVQLKPWKSASRGGGQGKGDVLYPRTFRDTKAKHNRRISRGGAAR